MKEDDRKQNLQPSKRHYDGYSCNESENSRKIRLTDKEPSRLRTPVLCGRERAAMSVSSDAKLLAMEPTSSKTSPASLPSHSKSAQPVKSGKPVALKGYPKEIMENGVDEKFCCGYCKLVLRNPLQSICGHRFCKGCNDAMRRLPPPLYCGSCLEEGMSQDESQLEPEKMFEDKAAKREMRKLSVTCVNPRCGWKGKFMDYVEHEENCEGREIQCPSCGIFVRKYQLHIHQVKQCPERLVPCGNCLENIVFSDKGKHDDVCPKMSVKCEACSREVHRAQMKNHKETTCESRTITCPLPECNNEFSMKNFLAHVGKPADSLQRHLAFAVEKTSILGKRVTKLEDCMANRIEAMPEPENAGQGAQQAAAADASPSGSIPDAPEASPGGADGALGPDDKQKLKLHEDLMQVLHSEILRCITKGEALGQSLSKEHNRVRDIYAIIETLKQRMSTLDAQTSPDISEVGSITEDGSGVATWRIEGFTQLRREAIGGSKYFVNSPPFFTGPGGYKMRMRLYANGEGFAKNSFISVFIQLLKGPHDELLHWPFSGRVYFMLVDQKDFTDHHVEYFDAEPNYPASIRPLGDPNVATGCPKFIQVTKLSVGHDNYLPRDVMFLKAFTELPEAARQRFQSLHPQKFAQMQSQNASAK